MLKTEIVIVPPLLIIIKQIGSALPHYIHDPLMRFDKTNLQGKDPKKRAPFMREERYIYIIESLENFVTYYPHMFQNYRFCLI
jgi:hypothetical protein